jgi:hypothetical protein
MDYGRWIARERKVRIKILLSSPQIRDTGVCRVCARCGELCLCHQETCPNCNSDAIGSKRLDGGRIEELAAERVRLRFRFKMLGDVTGKR